MDSGEVGYRNSEHSISDIEPSPMNLSVSTDLMKERSLSFSNKSVNLKHRNTEKLLSPTKLMKKISTD